MQSPNRFYYTWRLLFLHLSFARCFFFLLKLSFSPGRTGGFQLLRNNKKPVEVFAPTGFRYCSLLVPALFIRYFSLYKKQPQQFAAAVRFFRSRRYPDGLLFFTSFQIAQHPSQTELRRRPLPFCPRSARCGSCSFGLSVQPHGRACRLQRR